MNDALEFYILSANMYLKQKHLLRTGVFGPRGRCLLKSRMACRKQLPQDPGPGVEFLLSGFRALGL